jgi:hypothetical protein
MADQTFNLKLPFLLASQADKHVSVNQSLAILDAINCPVALTVGLSTPPAAPPEGSVHIVGPTVTTDSAWGGFAPGSLALYFSNEWQAIASKDGWTCFDLQAGKYLRKLGGQWSAFGPFELGLGSSAKYDTGTSGTKLALCNGSNVWSSPQKIAASGELFALQSSDVLFALNTSSGARMGYLRKIDGSQLALVNEQPGASLDLVTTGGGPITVNYQPIFHAGASPQPSLDNSFSLGAPTKRFSVLYATTGTINTSDAREKTPMIQIDERLLRVGYRLAKQIGKFQWLDSVQRKGATNARHHIGLTAQMVEAALNDEGVAPETLALFCRDGATKTEQKGTPSRQDTLGLRFDQVMMLMIASLAQRGAA